MPKRKVIAPPAATSEARPSAKKKNKVEAKEPTRVYSCYLYGGYAGYTVNIEQRAADHRDGGTRGAKATKHMKDASMCLVVWPFRDESAAKAFEYRMKHDDQCRKKSGLKWRIRRVLELVGENAIWQKNQKKSEPPHPQLTVTWIVPSQLLTPTQQLDWVSAAYGIGRQTLTHASCASNLSSLHTIMHPNGFVR